MTTAIFLSWKGKSGSTYQFETYPLGTEINPLPGVYIAARFVPAIGMITRDRMEALYVGETHDFSERLNPRSLHHDGLERAKSLGANYIALMICRDRSERLRIETDLRHGLRPVCNTQSVDGISLSGLFTR